MAGFDGRPVGTSGAALLYLQTASPKTARLVLSAGAVSAARGSRALVVELEEPSSGPTEAVLERSIALAQEALDIWAVRGVVARTLAAVADLHVVFIRGRDGSSRCRITTTTRINFTLEAHGQVLDASGRPLPTPPEPLPTWHPSFRFFRLGQASTDLVDAFRNHYLALESLLSTIEPMQLRPDGRPAERERAWLDRALARAAATVDLKKYAPPDTSADHVDALREEIYAGARTQTFHAKTGAPVLLPHDVATREALRDSVDRVRRLYLELAEASFDTRFIGEGGLAPAGFQAMASGVAIDAAYISPDDVSEEAGQGQLPPRRVRFPAGRDGRQDGDYRVVFVGETSTDQLPDNGIRQLGGCSGEQLLLYEDLEGTLDTTGLQHLECVFAVEAQDPRALGTRYLS